MISLTQTCALEKKLTQKIILPFSTAGDVPLLSLHRIRSRYGQIPVSADVRKALFGYLLKENTAYRQELQKNWYCLTLGHLDSATASLETQLQDQINVVFSLEENAQLGAEVKTLFQQSIGQTVAQTRAWFDEHYDELKYDTNSSILWPVVRALRTRLSRWALGELTVVQEPIQSVLADAAKTMGIDPDEYSSEVALYGALRKTARQ